MKRKMPTLEWRELIPYGISLSAIGLCLMQTDLLMDIGAILVPLGLLPLSIVLHRHKE